MKKTIALIFTLALSFQAVADVIQFRKHIYDSLEQLEQMGYARFDDSLASLRLAEDLASNRPSRLLVREATKALVKISHAGVLTSDDQTSINDVTLKLKKTLQLERIQFSRFSGVELNVVENFVLYSLFAESAPLVKIEYRGIAKDLALSLMITYFMESRSVKYDPDMKILLPSEVSEGAAKVVFILPEEKFEVPADGNSKDEISKRIGAIVPSNLPVQIKTRWFDEATYVHLEIFSIEAVQVVETYLRDTLVMGAGNRYLKAGANLLEFMHTRLSSLYIGGGAGRIQTGINLAANFLHGVEGKIRSSLNAAQWVAATDDTVRQMLQKETAMTIAHMTENLEQRLLHAKAAGSSEKFLEFEKEKTAKWIANAQKRLSDTIAKIDKSVADLDKSSAYKSASDSVKSTMRLEAAEGAARRNILSLDNWLKGVVIGISVYYVVEGAVQWSRAQSKDEADKIARTYGVKAANNLLYAVPGVNSLAFAWNATVGGLAFGGDKIFDYDFPDLSTERGLNFLIDKSNDLGFHLGGTTRFAFNRDNLLIKQGLFPLYKNEVGYWTGVELKKLEVATTNATDDIEKKAAQKTFGNEVRSVGLKNLTVLYALKNENLNESDYNQYLSELEQKWVSPSTGYSAYLRLVSGL